MKFRVKLMLLGLGLVNGLTAGYADVIVDGDQVIEGADISSISIDPVSGDINITAGGLYTITKDGDPPPGPQVTIDTLTAVPATIVEGESVVISWTTTNADSCTPSQGAGGWDQETIALPDGSTAPLTIATAGTYTFRLDCENDTPDSTFRTVSVQVDPDVGPPGPGNICPDDFVAPLSGTTVSWQALLGFTWPEPGYAEKVIGIPTAGYLAVEFSTGDVTEEDGGIKTIPHVSTQGYRLGALSACPGDFTDHLPGGVSGWPCTRTWFDGGTLNWSTEEFPASWECKLEPNTTYYLNLTFTDGVSAESDECVSDSSCRTILRVFN